MVISLEDFNKITRSLHSQKILVIGDIMLDRYVWGKANRVSEEAPVLVVEVDNRDERLGGAGNVVNNLVKLGAKVSLAGVVGPDFYGEKIKNRLRRMKVEASAVLSDLNRPTTTKKRVIARGQQVVRIDYEKRTPIGENIEKQLIKFLEDNINQFDGVVVSDYAKGALTKNILQKISELIKKNNLGISKCPVILDPKPANRAYYSGISIVKPNRKEAENISGIEINSLEAALDAAKKIHTDLGVSGVLLSLGSDGMLYYDKDHPQGIHSDTLARKVFDVSGAGDAVVSCFVAALSAGFSIDLSMSFANFGAAYVVSEVGTVPVDLEVMQKELEYYYKSK